MQSSKTRQAQRGLAMETEKIVGHDAAGKEAFFKTRMISLTPMVPLPVEEVIEAGDAEMDDASEGSEDSGIDSTSHQDAVPRQKTKKRRGAWLIANFKKKSCIKFVQDPDMSATVCFCGRPKRAHISFSQDLPVKDSLSPLKYFTDTGSGRMPYQILQDSTRNIRVAPDGQESPECWSAEEHLVEVPTDAFGEIHFNEAVDRVCTSKFVRLSDRTEMKLVLDLMTKYWKLSKPQLVISLTGGGRSFKLNEKDKETFSRGVIKAAWTTDAWIITSGFNAGVPKIVGQAVQASHTWDWIKANKRSFGSSKLKCIGLAPWGYVDGSQQLLTRHGKGSYPAEYKVNPVVMKGRPVPLNPDHTHFILIDTGRKGEQAYGGEIVMRSMIEEALAAPQEDNGLGLPVVLVVLEGGVDTLLNVKNAVLRGIPTVVCDGSGRAADVIAFAHNRAEGESESRTLSDKNREVLRNKLQNFFNIDPNNENMNQLIEDVIVCIRDKKLITVFQMVDISENSGLDHAILIALLKAQATTSTYKLALALSWNRVDVAERKIFVDDENWTPGSLDPFIMQSLMHNQVDFLRLFLEKGVIMQDFLTVSRLRRLYNSISLQHSLRSYVAMVNNTKIGRPIFLCHISQVIKFLMGIHRNKLYVYDKPFSSDKMESVGLIALSSTLAGSLLTHQAQEEYLKSEFGWSVTSGSSQKLSMIELANPGLHFKKPFRELFLAAVLMGRMEMAKFFWERIEDAVCGGIVASTILKGISALCKDPDDILEAEKNARNFEQLAVNVMDECYRTDEILAERLIQCPNKHWGGKSILKMAAESDNKTFIAHTCAQSVVEKSWMGGMRASTLAVGLATLCPLFIFRIKFVDLQSPCKGKFSRSAKLRMFSNSPITKFGTFVLSYVAFLLMYSYVMLDTFGDSPSIPECVLFGWIFTTIIEEVRQSFIPGEHETIRQRLREWASNEWNVMDCISIVVATLAFILHWFAAALEWSKAFYALNCFFYYSRLLRLFSVSEKLGPKMVMIRKMVFEMVLFLCILLVFLLGYGVASNVLLYPHQDFGWESIKNTVYMPYFQIYGELFLDIIVNDGQSSCDPQEMTCPRQHLLQPIMLGAYLLLGNVLLLNLLIAIFSSIFDEVQTNSLEVWKFELYFLMVEFEDRPALPPPFIILEHAYLILRWVWRKICHKCCKKASPKVLYLNKKMKRALRAFEKECAANYRRKKNEEKYIQTPERLNQLDRRLKDLDRQTEKTKEDLQRRLQHIQQQLEDMANSNLELGRTESSSNDEQRRQAEASSVDAESLGQAATTAEARRYSGTRQLMMDLERKRSISAAPRQSAKQREKVLLCQLNQEMVQTAPSSLRLGLALLEEEDSAEGSDSDNKHRPRKRSTNAKVGARRLSKSEVRGSDRNLQRTSSL
ncbi:transient receptor potential cation channel trpm-like isoform X2 [Acanthaster planci]|uniref:Transient receptor potential cation channel trpm-like isoform X2 n=1 Tax=Acanthaster planci TaxID=133434 RepID=A0A8B7YTG1_ACAPL|nr:transient receptor potential cation channel trpm-like isoform X2 [Acanthaster planci]